MLNRRSFLQGTATVGAGILTQPALFATAGSVAESPQTGEDIFRFVKRTMGRHDVRTCAQILGAANEFKEGDHTVGVAAANDSARRNARTAAFQHSRC